jgi:hypothetical protein
MGCTPLSYTPRRWGMCTIYLCEAEVREQPPLCQ